MTWHTADTDGTPEPAASGNDTGEQHPTGLDSAAAPADTGPVEDGDAGAGQLAIQRAARQAFTRRPYAEVTLRGIAADAGVSASLIVKRFGSKEQLFNTVADFGPAADELFAVSLDVLGRHLVLTVVRTRRAQQGDPLLRVVFSLGNTDERSLLRERFRQQVTVRLSELLPGSEGELRAELIVGQLLGLGATLSLHPSGSAAQVPAEQLAELYAPALQRLVTGR